MKKFTMTAEMMGKLITKAGLMESDDFKGYNEGEADAELTQDQFDKLTGSLLSIPDAIKHPEVTKEVIKGAKAGIFGPTEEAMKAILKENGVDDATIKTLLDGKTNDEKVKSAMKHIKTLVDADKSKTKEQRELEWQQKEEDYKKKLADTEKLYNDEKAGRELDRTMGQLETFVTNSENFTLIDTLPKSTILRIVREDALKVAESKGAKLVVTENGLSLVDKEDPTKPYHAPGASEPANLKDFLYPVIDAAGFINKQSGSTSKQEIHNPNPVKVGSGVVASVNTNHQILEASLKSRQQ